MTRRRSMRDQPPTVHRVVARVGASLALVASLFVSAGLGFAGEPEAVSARGRCDARSICQFSVTLKHADEGWEHFADRWEVVGADGGVLATRVLRHPHVDEQPFTRSLAGVSLPATLRTVGIRAHDSKHGYGTALLEVELLRPVKESPLRDPVKDGGAGDDPGAQQDGG